ncbi:tyrosine-type recombinase/integrase [Sphingomonas paucimobilis]|uniref:tyrosine-type recombinase/integrase n=1 Tax=Sphingomonas paucimobilis TaxID=13689 RepID=UPI002D7EC0D3|nr:tyrosine-type recombinase/integrase [Sphingomonas paucimobilis]
MKSYIRFLVVQGECRPALLHAIPSVQRYRLSTLPRYVDPATIEEIIAACPTDRPVEVRDKAIILLLARLGLRAGDIRDLLLDDIDWRSGHLKVKGKTRRPDRLPLPQDVGDAILRAIMTAALDVPPQDMISPHTYHYLFGLLAATGLRISEALALQCTDLVEDGLIVRNGKFSKQRLIALQPSTRQALEAYLAMRKKLGATGSDLFVSIRGRAPTKTRAHVVFVRLARHLGYRGPTGKSGMRLHDLRHTFAVRSLEACPPDREAIAHHMAGLSVYLGHASVANTYWYLEATPVLLRDIAAASEQLYRGEAA